MIKPQRVAFYVVIPDPEAIGCAAVRWDFGDGSVSQHAADPCELQARRAIVFHDFRSYGSFRPRLALLDPQDGHAVVSAWTRILIVEPE